MPTLDTYKKRAKLLLRWHREGNPSVGGRIRQLPRHRALSDVEARALRFPLSEAQEIVALEAGYGSWAELKAANPSRDGRAEDREMVLNRATPVLFVRDVVAAAEFYRDRLGFAIGFQHGRPPFYGSVSRDAAVLRLRLVPEAVYTTDIVPREDLIMAFVEVADVRGLYAEYLAAGVEFAKTLTQEAWGGTAFTVHDPDGNRICFAAR